MSITVYSVKEAWEKANEIFPTDYNKDETKSQSAGYDVYTSTICDAWISDLGSRLEVNLEDGTTINIWIKEIKEYQIDDALSVVSDAIYEIDDKIHPEIQKLLGIDEARTILYEAYAKAKAVLDSAKPGSNLIKKYNL